MALRWARRCCGPKRVNWFAAGSNFVQISLGEFDPGPDSTRFTDFVRNQLSLRNFCSHSGGSHRRHKSDPETDEL